VKFLPQVIIKKQLVANALLKKSKKAAKMNYAEKGGKTLPI
jgi:hypothetical protein